MSTADDCQRWGITDAVLPILALLCLSRERRCRLSQLPQELPARYTASDRLQNFSVDRSRELIDRLQATPDLLTQILASESGTALSTDAIDGLRVTFASGEIVHLRPSGNAPELRCYAEADSQARAKELCEACLQRVFTTTCQ